MSPKINGIYYNEDKNFDSGRCKMSTLLKEIEPLQQALEDSFILFITDEQGMILYGNARLVQISQYAQDELIGQHVRMLKSKIHPPRFYQEIEKRIAAGKVWHDEICVRAKDGTEYWVDMTVIPVRSNREEKVQYLWFGHSITDRKRTERSLERSLQELRDMKQALDESSIMAVTDRRGVITYVNDKFCEISKYSREELIGNTHRVVNSGYHSREFFDTMWKTIASGKVWKGVTLEQMQIYVSPSIGISMYPDDGEEIEELLKNADTAMYLAKEKGKNNYQFYSAESHQVVSVRMIMENELYKALDQNQLLLEYQPVVGLNQQRVVGMEALLRWLHPELGKVPPMQFIPLAEETGLIVPIGEWVLQEACKHTKMWHDQGFSDLTIAVNISWRQFMHDDFCGMIRRALEESGLAPQYLELEITESMARDAEYAIRVLHQIKEMGVKISIDDFGTGYSSLSYLSQFPIDRLKIDQSFIRDLNESNQAIVKTIIDMAYNMNISVVAEGVENTENIDFLKKLGCPRAQGYYYSRPLPAAEALEYMRSMAK